MALDSTYQILKDTILFMGVLLISFSGYAQFYVGDKADLSVKGELSTKNKEVIIKTNVSGEGIIYFNNVKAQNLITIENINLPEIEIIDNKNFSTDSRFNVNGNLTITNASVMVNEQINLKGYIKLQNNADLMGREFILENINFDNYNLTSSITKNQKLPFYFSVGINEDEFSKTTVKQLKDKLNFYTNSFLSYENNKPNPPPPKYTWI